MLPPEEEYAVTGGPHGYDPEAEGLGGTIEDEILKSHTDKAVRPVSEGLLAAGGDTAVLRRHQR